MEFSSFVPSVKQELDSYQANKDAIKAKRKQEKLEKETAAATTAITNDKTSNTAEPLTTETLNGGSAHDDGVATADEDEDATNKPESEEPQAKKPKTTEDTISETEN